MGIEYDGTAYNGWQKQNVGIGIQTIVETAISKVANHEIRTICAGRTDAGVHAKAQIIHFDTMIDRSNHGWLAGTNSNLPDDINITWVKSVDEEFHARFSAVNRTYYYQILNQDIRSSLARDRAWWVYEPLDLSKMQTGAEVLIGKHDFTAFRSVDCQAKSPIKTIDNITIENEGELIEIYVEAKSFLMNQVRIIAGTLVDVGLLKKTNKDVQSALDNKDRKFSGPTAPSCALILQKVIY